MDWIGWISLSWVRHRACCGANNRGSRAHHIRERKSQKSLARDPAQSTCFGTLIKGSKKSWRYQVPGRTSTRCPCPWHYPLYKFLKPNPRDWTSQTWEALGEEGRCLNVGVQQRLAIPTLFTSISTKAEQFQHYYGSALASLTHKTNFKFPPQILPLLQIGEDREE